VTPAAIRTLSNLRHEVYMLFAVTMKASVNVTSGSSSASNPAMAFWLDSQQLLNYLYIYAHTAPDELVPERPFVLRVAVNKRAGIVSTIGREKGCRGINRSWQFELTLLPEEILDFVPWIVDLIKSYDSDFAFLIPEPPHPIESDISEITASHSAQTLAASAQLARYVDERALLTVGEPQ